MMGGSVKFHDRWLDTKSVYDQHPLNLYAAVADMLSFVPDMDAFFSQVRLYSAFSRLDLYR